MTSSSARHCHRARHRVWHSLLMVTLVCTQMVTVHAMLDALKALFILTGASTYLGECVLLGPVATAAALQTLHRPSVDDRDAHSSLTRFKVCPARMHAPP